MKNWKVLWEENQWITWKKLVVMKLWGWNTTCIKFKVIFGV